jgi:hypothetical protein
LHCIGTKSFGDRDAGQSDEALTESGDVDFSSCSLVFARNNPRQFYDAILDTVAVQVASRLYIPQTP